MTTLTPPATIAFIGLGMMGRPMAARLAEAGFKLRLYDLSQKAVSDFVGAHPSALATASPKAAVQGADAVVTMLPDGKVVRQALIEGRDAAREGMAAGMLAIDMSSSNPVDTQKLARELLGVDGVGRAHVDGEHARGHALARRIAALDQRLPHDLAVGQHGDHGIGALHRRLGRGGRQRRGMRADEVRHCLLREVVQAELEARLGEARGHRPAHHAEPDEGDGGGRCKRGHAAVLAVRSYS